MGKGLTNVLIVFGILLLTLISMLLHAVVRLLSRETISVRMLIISASVLG